MTMLARQARQKRDARRVARLALVGAIGCLLLAWCCRGQCVDGVCPAPGWRSATRPTTSPAVAIPDRIAAALCRVVSDTTAGRSLGSGALIQSDGGTGYVLTCGHLFDGGPGRVSVGFTSGQRFAAEVVAMDRPHDVALLKIRAPAATPLGVGEPPTGGAALTCSGFGAAAKLRSVRGPLLGFAKAAGATHASARIAAGVRSGDSGGPVLDASGRLVGVIWGVRNGVTYAATGEPIRRLLRRIPSRVAQRPTGAAPVQVPDSRWDDRLAAVESRLAALVPCQCPQDVATRADLGDLVRRQDLAGFATAGDLDRAIAPLRVEVQQTPSRLQRLRAEVVERARDAAAGAFKERVDRLDLPAIGWSKAQVLLASLGVGGPIGLAMLAGRLLVRRRLRRRGRGGPRPDRFPEPPNR